jgi:hypothetical protein
VVLAPVDAENSMMEVVKLATDPDYGFILVAEGGGVIIGVLGLVKARWWYNHSAEFLIDRFFFCTEETRNSGVGRALKTEAEKIAMDLRCPVIINGKLKKTGPMSYHTLPDVKGHRPSLQPNGKPTN